MCLFVFSILSLCCYYLSIIISSPYLICLTPPPLSHCPSVKLFFSPISSIPTLSLIPPTFLCPYFSSQHPSHCSLSLHINAWNGQTPPTTSNPLYLSPCPLETELVCSGPSLFSCNTQCCVDKLNSCVDTSD